MKTCITIFPFDDIMLDRLLNKRPSVIVGKAWEKLSLSETILEPQTYSTYGTRLYTKMLPEYFIPVFTDNIYGETSINKDCLLLAGLITKTDKDIYIHPLNGDFRDTIELSTLLVEDGLRHKTACEVLLEQTFDITEHLSNIEKQSVVGLDYIETNEAIIGTNPFYSGAEAALIKDAQTKGLDRSDSLNPLVATVLWQKIQHGQNSEILHFEHAHRKTLLKLVGMLFEHAKSFHAEKGLNDIFEDFDSIYKHYNKSVFE